MTSIFRYRLHFPHLAKYRNIAHFKRLTFNLHLYAFPCSAYHFPLCPTYVCYYRHAGQQRSITGGVCHARTCIHKNDTTLCKSHGQEPEGQHEYSKEQDGIINNTPYYIYHYFISYSKYRPLPLTVQGGPVGLVGWKKIILASLRYFFPPSLAPVIGKEQPGQ